MLSCVSLSAEVGRRLEKKATVEGGAFLCKVGRSNRVEEDKEGYQNMQELYVPVEM